MDKKIYFVGYPNDGTVWAEDMFKERVMDCATGMSFNGAKKHIKKMGEPKKACIYKIVRVEKQ